MLGKVVYMLPKPKLNNGIDISELSNGIYSIEITEEKTKNIFVKKFIKQ
jgi:hypothetical protein